MEGKLRQIANPHSEKRMNLILQQLMDTVKYVIQDDPLDVDEVNSCITNLHACVTREQNANQPNVTVM